MKVVILCGGRGTRIRDVSENVPKPMVTVGQWPILWHIMKYFARWGHQEFVLCLGYKGEAIKDYFLNYAARTSDFTVTLGNEKEIQYHTRNGEADWRVTFAETGLDAMTGARIRKIKNYVGNENFFLTYGDGLADVNPDKLLAYHRAHGKILTVTGVLPTGRFGEILSDEKDLVTTFNEKPKGTVGRVSGGFFVCRPDLFEVLPEREDLVFELEPMNQLVQNKQLMMYRHDGFWQPMDTYRDYAHLNDLWNRGQAPWRVW
ncbi:MAG: glucose-1-phosphate cytidylyltransferase [Elusimicrobia bacterium]|nr:glucose-1-phosphate cytidylyltransferase [Elusimicrobiota bacterium]